MLLYVGDQTQLVLDKEVGISGSVVKQLMENYLGRGHVVYLDNWYTSPLLARFLLQHRTGVCGTVKQRRKHMPKGEKLAKKQVKFQVSNGILLTTWMDKREVNMLSTINKPLVYKTNSMDWSGNSERGRKIWKPEPVIYYNKNMRLVDKSDSMISSIDCARKTFKWYKKLFFHLLDVIVLNAHILHKHVTKKEDTLEDFATEVCREILETYATDRGMQNKGRLSRDSPLRLTERHFMKMCGNGGASGRNQQRRCHVCSHTTLSTPARKMTSFFCAKCDVGLCIVPCFEVYHTQEEY